MELQDHFSRLFAQEGASQEAVNAMRDLFCGFRRDDAYAFSNACFAIRQHMEGVFADNSVGDILPHYAQELPVDEAGICLL